MILSLQEDILRTYVSKQVNNLFPDNSAVDIEIEMIRGALKRIDHCFSHVTLKHYFNGKETIFNHLYSDQYVMFVWYLANEIYKKYGRNTVSDKLYYLNKSVNGIDCMYDTKLPDIFLIFHGVGTMLGKASYSDFFVTLHGCTIGSQKGDYPVMGKGVSLTAHASIIGKCTIGDRVSISAYSSIFNKDLESDRVVFKDDSGLTQIKQSNNCYAQQFFNVDLKKL